MADVFKLRRYFNNLTGETLEHCMFHLIEEDGREETRSFQITHAKNATSKKRSIKITRAKDDKPIQVTKIQFLARGNNHGALCLSVGDKASVGTCHQIFLTFSPDRQASQVAKTLKKWMNWTPIVSVLGPRYENDVPQFSRR